MLWGGVYQRRYAPVLGTTLTGLVEVMCQTLWMPGWYTLVYAGDADWKSLKTWLPSQIKRKQKTNGTSTVNMRLVNRCYQWCWRRSVESLPPGKFLKEFSKILAPSKR